MHREIVCCCRSNSTITRWRIQTEIDFLLGYSEKRDVLMMFDQVSSVIDSTKELNCPVELQELSSSFLFSSSSTIDYFYSDASQISVENPILLSCHFVCQFSFHVHSSIVIGTGLCVLSSFKQSFGRVEIRTKRFIVSDQVTNSIKRRFLLFEDREREKKKVKNSKNNFYSLHIAISAAMT